MNKNKLIIFVAIGGTLILALVAIFAATRLFQSRGEEVDTSKANVQSCLIYAVHDEGGDDSQIITIDPQNDYSVQPLGILHYNANIEGLDMHPVTKEIYGTSGPKSGTDEGVLYKINKTTGELQRIGYSGFAGIPALSFRPTDNTLWGWAHHKGIVTIDLTTGAATLIYSKDAVMQSMAWSNDGQTLYIADNSHTLYSYDPNAKTLQAIATNLDGERTEALEMTSDGYLLGSYHSSSPDRSIFAYDAQSTSYIAAKSIVTQYNDIEGIAWPEDCGPALTPVGSSTPLPSPTPPNYQACTLLSFDLTTPSPTPIPGEPAIDLEKHTNGYDADQPKGPELVEGDSVKWEYIVTNTGDKTLYNIKVIDDKEGDVTSKCPQTTLLANETMTCTLYSTAKVYQYSNSATVTASDADNNEVSDTDTSHYWGEGKPYSPTPNPTGTPSSSGTPTAGSSGTPKATSTTTAIAAAPASSAEPLPSAGVAMPTFIGISSAALLLLGALLLVM